VNHFQRFEDNVKYFVNLALAEPGLDPKSFTKKISIALVKEKNSPAIQERINQYAQERKINALVHFTHVDNLEIILKYALIPRIFLEKEAMRIGLRTTLADHQHRDGFKVVSTLSISALDYEMFQKLSKGDEENWAIIFFNIEPIKKHLCNFNPGDISKMMAGVKGLEAMFGDPERREELQLEPWLPTDPGAEVFEYSAIPPFWIKSIYFSTNKHLEKVKRWGSPHGINVEVNNEYFFPANYRESRASFNGDIEDIRKDALWEAFESAIKYSQSSLFIISGWISDRVINDDVLKLFELAIKRGVKICMGYGYKHMGEHEERPDERRALKKLKKLRDSSRGEVENLKVSKYATHEKIIIVDTEYIINGSINWLSSSFSENENDERGTKLISKDLTEKMKKEYEEKFSKLENILVSRNGG